MRTEIGKFVVVENADYVIFFEPVDMYVFGHVYVLKWSVSIAKRLVADVDWLFAHRETPIYAAVRDDDYPVQRFLKFLKFWPDHRRPNRAGVIHQIWMREPDRERREAA